MLAFDPHLQTVFFFREMQMQFGQKEGRKLIKQLKVLLLRKWNRMNVKVVVEASSASEKVFANPLISKMIQRQTFTRFANVR